MLNLSLHTSYRLGLQLDGCAPLEEPKDGGAAGMMERGFKKAGSSIKGFFTGKKKEE